ncbi:MAG: hypothetical protein KF690_09150 [Bacteroidetes bacterium]|nr:hypothetical protein [Bacteroidota bacterium]
MKFKDTPLFVTDEQGTRVKVILHIEDFYTLLAHVDGRNHTDSPQDTEERAFGENAPAAGTAITQAGLAALPQAVTAAPAISASAHTPEQEAQTDRRKSSEEVFFKAFDQVKRKKD